MMIASIKSLSAVSLCQPVLTSCTVFCLCVQAMADWLCPSKVPVRWTFRQRTWRTGRVESPTVRLNQETTSSQSASLRNMSQVKAKHFLQITLRVDKNVIDAILTVHLEYKLLIPFPQRQNCIFEDWNYLCVKCDILSEAMDYLEWQIFIINPVFLYCFVMP